MNPATTAFRMNLRVGLRRMRRSGGRRRCGRWVCGPGKSRESPHSSSGRASWIQPGTRVPVGRRDPLTDTRLTTTARTSMMESGSCDHEVAALPAATAGARNNHRHRYRRMLLCCLDRQRGAAEARCHRRGTALGKCRPATPAELGPGRQLAVRGSIGPPHRPRRRLGHSQVPMPASRMVT